MDVRGERQTDRHCIIKGWQAEEDEDVDIEFSQEDVDGADEAGNQAAAAAVAPSLTGFCILYMGGGPQCEDGFVMIPLL